MGRVAIFIDGGYLDKVLAFEHGSARIDLLKLSDKIATGHDRLRTYYYHCLPYQSNPADIEESQRFSRSQGYFDTLDRLPRFQVRLGRLAFRGFDSDGKPIFEQKKVDVLFAVDLVQLATKHQITEAALITCDSDFLPAIEVAKQEGVLVRLFHGNNPRPHNELYNCVDERILMDKPLIEAVIRNRP